MGIGVGYSSRLYTGFNGGRLSGIAGESNTTSEFEGAPLLELDLRIMSKNSPYGFQTGVVIDFEHKNRSTTINGISNSTSVFERSKLSTYTLEGSLAGRFERFFVMAGINYSVISFSPSRNFSGSTSMQGGNNTHIGLGYYINDNFAIELMLWRRKRLKFSTTASNGTADSYGTGEAAATNLTLKYFPTFKY